MVLLTAYSRLVPNGLELGENGGLTHWLLCSELLEIDLRPSAEEKKH